MFLRFLPFSLLLVLLPLIAGAATFSYTTPPGALRKVYGSTPFRFGYLTVPENHSNPTGTSIQLAVVILKAKKAVNLPPVFFLTGGPGGSSTQDAVYFGIFEALQDKHDVVLIDQRGTGYSKPFLNVSVSLARSKENLAARGYDVSKYNTTQNAADIADLRVALGYDEVILFGNSYGTFLAQEVMRNHPEGIAAVVINGVLPATDTFIPRFNKNSLHGLNALFKDIRANGPARRAFPSFSRTYFKLLERLKKGPVLIEWDFKITLGDFQRTIQGLLQSSERIRVIPLLVSEIVAKRDSSWLRFYLQRRGGGNFDFSYGMYLSTLGTDWNQPNWLELTKRFDRTLKPEIFRQTNAPDSLYVISDVRSWNVPYAPEDTRTALTSDIPTLLLAGAMEAQTPPNGANTVARGLSRAYNLFFPRSGHITGFTPGPALQALVQFANNPQKKPVYSLAPLKRNNFYLTKVPASMKRAGEASERPLKFMP